MKKILALLLAIAFMAITSQAALALTYTGSIATPNGIHGTTPWSDNMQISWSISQNGDMSWDYEYTFNYEFKDVSHMIVAISPAATSDDFWDSNHGNLQIGTYSGNDPSNPGLPSTNFYGLKIDVTNENSASIFSFTSSKAPVWGDFYIKDGQYDGHDVYAYNSTFGTPDPTDAPADGSINYKILRPDSVSTIPEPSSMLLLGSALALFGGARRFRRK